VVLWFVLGAWGGGVGGRSSECDWRADPQVVLWGPGEGVGGAAGGRRQRKQHGGGHGLAVAENWLKKKNCMTKWAGSGRQKKQLGLMRITQGQTDRLCRKMKDKPANNGRETG